MHEKKEREEKERGEQVQINNQEAMKVLSFDNENKINQAIKILTKTKRSYY